MTVNETLFTNWSTRQPGAPYNYNSPNLMQIKDYLTRRYGGQDLGCYGIRPIRGGTIWSTHSFGAAFDWRYENPGPGRVIALQIMDYLVDHSKELGIQAIHDYVGCRIWRSNRFDGGGAYWKTQTAGSEGGTMGASWAQWIHIETTEQSWGDTRSVEERVEPEVVVPQPTLKYGMQGPEVLKLQQFLKFFGYAFTKVEEKKLTARYGISTRRGVKRLQKDLNVEADGNYGPMTAAAWKKKISGK